MPGSTIQENFKQVHDDLVESAIRSGRNLSDVTLVAVTKTHPIDKIVAAYEAGLRHFGENRVEEAEDKIKSGQAGTLADDVVWHMIGHIQSRKTSMVASLFDWVHSIDRLKIARRLDNKLAELDRTQDVLLEVNVSGETSKFGFNLAGWPDDGQMAESQLETLVVAVEQIVGLSRLRLRGLMTLAPYTTNPETVRPIFRRMRQLRDILSERFPAEHWDHLSMGMSSDYQVAVEEGATIVRIGTAIFGEREPY